MPNWEILERLPEIALAIVGAPALGGPVIARNGAAPSAREL